MKRTPVTVLLAIVLVTAASADSLLPLSEFLDGLARHSIGDTILAATPADVTQDGIVNELDFAAVARHLNEPVRAANARFDVNRSGDINTLDLLAVRSRMGVPSAAGGGTGAPIAAANGSVPIATTFGIQTLGGASSASCSVGSVVDLRVLIVTNDNVGGYAYDVALPALPITPWELRSYELSDCGWEEDPSSWDTSVPLRGALPANVPPGPHTSTCRTPPGTMVTGTVTACRYELWIPWDTPPADHVLSLESVEAGSGTGALLSSVSAPGTLTLTVVDDHHVTFAPDEPSGNPNPVASGGVVTCTAGASDSRGHALSYVWSATDGGGAAAGSFDDAAAQNPTWTAPENRTDANVEYTISVTATCPMDSAKSASASYQQTVAPAPHELTITAGPTGAPNPVASGGDVTCSVTAEDSRLGHGMTYAWAATGGALNDAAAQNPTWTAPENHTDAPVDYTIEVTVSCTDDPAVSDTAFFTQTVLPVDHEMTIAAGPAGVPNPVASSGNVTCSVTAVDSQLGHGMAYAWTATGGTFDDAAAQNPTWTAPENRTDAPVAYTFEVAVSCTDDPAVSDTASFIETVLSVDHEVTITAGPTGVPNPVTSGGDVTCGVTAEDSQVGHGMAYAWTATGGTFDDAAAQNPTWTAPENRTDANVEYTISVTVNCAEDNRVAASASYTQRVEPVAHTLTIIAAPQGDPNPAAPCGEVQCAVTAEDSRRHDLVYEWTATGGSFDDPTARDPVWSAPSMLGDCRIAVTVTCAEDDAMSASASYVQEVTVHHTFSPGVQMVAVPVEPDDPDPAQLGLGAGNWARWNPSIAGYAGYPDPYTRFDTPDGTPGKGYWARFGAQTTVSVPGAPPADDAYTMPAPAGWVQIGNPRLEDVPWRITGAGALMVRRGGDQKTLAEAQAAGWCEDFAWAYRTGVGYELVYDRSVAIVGARDKLSPWEGYWFRAYQPLTLIFPAVGTADVAAAPLLGEKAEGEWSVAFVAALNDGARAQVVVGQAAAARQMVLPPGFGNRVALSVVESNNRLGVDLRERSEAPQWMLEAVTSAPNAQVTLRWPDLSEMPHDCRPVLVDLGCAERVDMRTSHGYTYTTGGAAETRRFQVCITPLATGTLTVTGVAAAVGGGNVELRVSLSAAATVDAEVLNMAGRRVGTVCRRREMEAGPAVMVWNATSDRGTRLPGGRYLVRVTARVDDGQQTSAIAPLQLGR